MSDDHAFCRTMLSLARDEAREKHVAVPSHMTAMESMGDAYFVQGKNDKGEYVTAHCAFDAKAKRIHALIKIEADLIRDPFVAAVREPLDEYEPGCKSWRTRGESNVTEIDKS